MKLSRFVMAVGVAVCPLLLLAQGVEVSQADHAVTTPLRDVPPLSPKQEHRRIPFRAVPLQAGGSLTNDVQTSAPTAPSFASGTQFPGVGEGDYGFSPNAAPPDTNGAVGADFTTPDGVTHNGQYVQWVNESFAVFDKRTGTLLYGPAAGNTLFQALGASHPCAVHNDGDPIAQYDKLANRWVMGQFSVTNGSSQGYWYCAAVSTSADATGTWNVYAFNYGTVQFPDYPKIGVWPDAYYATYNIFNNGSTFAGPKVCAFDRNSMLAGSAATQQCFQLSTSYGSLLPTDLDGSNLPPAGSPEYFLNFGSNSLNVWKMHVDWTNTANTTLSSPVNLPVNSFAKACNGGTCVPQLNTSQKLDSLGDRLMYRLAYRHFADGHEAMVVNHAVQIGGKRGNVGVRWYELRVANQAVSVYQQSTYSPDSSFRWMASAAMDKVGNLAVGYSISSKSMYPSIRFAARAPSDPLNTLGAEANLKDGTGSQTQNLNRWGDYSALSVDPQDDCTMYYTNEYLKTNGTFNWSTWISSFKFASCQ